MAYSNRTQNEIWTIKDRVLCFQCSPEINKTYIKELIINKLYDVGKLDDNQKNASIEQLEDMMIPISRHFILKCLEMFLKTPNEEMQKLFKREVDELQARRRFLVDNAPRVINGQPISKKSVSDNISKQIPNGPNACAIDLVGKEYAKTPSAFVP